MRGQIPVAARCVPLCPVVSRSPFRPYLVYKRKNASLRNPRGGSMKKVASPVRTPQEPFPLSHFSGQSVGLSTQRARVRTPQVPFLCHKSRNRSRSYRIGSYRIASYRIESHRIESNRIRSYRIASYRIFRLVSPRLASHHCPHLVS